MKIVYEIGEAKNASESNNCSQKSEQKDVLEISLKIFFF